MAEKKIELPPLKEQPEGLVISPRGVADLFVGMLYAALISRLLTEAKNNNLFDKIPGIILMWVILLYFSQDWLSRELGNQQARQAQGNVPTLARFVFIKFFLDVTLVFLMHLGSLHIIKIASKSENFSFQPDDYLLICLTLFSITNLVWNWVVIGFSGLVNKKDLQCLLTLTVPSKLIALFPHLSIWQNKVKLNMASMQTIKKNGNGSLPGWEYVPTAITSIKCLIWYGLTGMLKILCPYLLIAHLLLFYAFLTISIIISLVLNPIPIPWYVVLAAFAISWLCYTFHLAPIPETGESLERFATIFLLIGFFLLYLAIPTKWLLHTMVIQQFSANLAIMAFFKPLSTTS